MPGDEVKEYLRRDTVDIKLVSDYTGINFNDVVELDCYTYKILLKDAFIHKLSETPDGQEYLETAWILQQSEPNRDALRKALKEGGNI